jgi:hypothetical protein
VARTVRAASGGKFAKCGLELLRTAAACGAKEVDAFQSSDHTVLSAKEKGRLAANADAVEMEGFAILSEVQRLQVPAVAVRTIGDISSQDLPLDFNLTVGPQGHISIPRVLGQLARNPRRLPGLVRLGRDSQHAAKRLALFLDRFVGELATSARPAEMQEEVAVG